jgi:hypothetical protein
MRNQDGVVNMTKAMQALSPWLKHPRRTIAQVEGLVLVAAALLLLQLFLGFFRRRYRCRNSFVNTVLGASSKLMEALIIYTLGTMESSPIKNSSYPVWAVFLIMASSGTTAVQYYDFCDSVNNKCMEAVVTTIKYVFYYIMFLLLLNPNTYTLKAALGLSRHHKKPRASSSCVVALFYFALVTKAWEYFIVVYLVYRKQKPIHLILTKIRRRRTQKEGASARKATTETDSDPRSVKGYEYAVCYRLGGGGLVTIDQIWDRLNANSAACLKDLCLSYALFVQLKNRRFFGIVRPKTSSARKDHDFVFKKLLPSCEGDFKRAFRIIEAELGFCYDFFFTKYYYTFLMTNQLPVPFIQTFVLGKIVLILIVGVFAVSNSLVLETPNPLIEVHISRGDYIITLLLLGIALIVELGHATFYLASDWAQVSLATMYVKRHWYETSASFFGQVIAFVRRFTKHPVSGPPMRNRMKLYSIILPQRQQPGPVEVSDAVKRAVARSLISTYGGKDEASQWQDQMPFHRYSWALKGLSAGSHVDLARRNSQLNTVIFLLVLLLVIGRLDADAVCTKASQLNCLDTCLGMR